jgi:hypothetical protein
VLVHTFFSWFIWQELSAEDGYAKMKKSFTYMTRNWILGLISYFFLILKDHYINFEFLGGAMVTPAHLFLCLENIFVKF